MEKLEIKPSEGLLYFNSLFSGEGQEKEDSDIEVLKEQLNSVIHDPSRGYGEDIQPVCRIHAVDKHGWGYRRL